jgi:hypothetical protein
MPRAKSADAAKKRTAPKRAGRPSSYREEYAKQAYHLCILGATDAALSRAFGVSDVTIDNWKRAHPAFVGALKAGKEQADAKVAQSLFRRALGYRHPAVKIVTVARGGNMGSDVEAVPYTERYAPDTVACIFWLKNRRPDLWRDRTEIGIDKLDALTDAELEAIAAGKAPH